MITVFTTYASDNTRVVLTRTRNSATLSFPDFNGANIDVAISPTAAEVTLDYWRTHAFTFEIEHYDDAHLDDYDDSFDDAHFLDDYGDLPEDWSSCLA